MFAARQGFFSSTESGPSALTLVANVTRVGSTSSGDFQFRFAGNVSDTIDVNWGDGNVDTVIGGSITLHTYANTTTLKTIKIVGNTTGLRFDDANKIMDVTNWGMSTINSSANMFANAKGLTTFSAQDTPILSGGTDFMFRGCANLVDSNIANWDVSNVTTMRSMFREATSFNANISSWSVANLSNVNNMFQNASSFTQNLSSWTTNVVVQPSSFSANANATFANNANLRKPFLQGGTVRINT